MRKQYVIGNWKMNGTKASSLSLAKDIVQNLPHPLENVEVVICPPAVYLDSISQSVTLEKMKLGAQDVATDNQGAYTGQISPLMLKEMGCEYVLVGHSERRHGLHESNELVAHKVKACLQAELTPVICVGETLEQREGNQAFETILGQLTPVLELGAEALSKSLIAYEPVWAIGTGKTATAAQAQEIHAFIRKEVAKAGQNVAQSLPILYGGSVKPSNAQELVACDDIDGGLIGGASLQASDFLEIVQATQRVVQLTAV